MSPEDALCEQHFVNNFTRNSSGCFIVKLPFKPGQHEFPRSFEIAKRQFLSLDRRFDRDPNLHSRYIEFMSEYLKLSHMRKINFQSEEELRIGSSFHIMG